jgi:ABC-2 type transport system permease protein
VSRPAPAVRAVATLAAFELRLLRRRFENLLVTLVIPAAVLLFFAGTAIAPPGPGRPVDFLLPGAIALAIVATGLVNLGIATAYDRQYGVLKRLGGAPIDKWVVIAARAGTCVVIVAIQVVVLALVASLALGWAPGAGWSPALFVVAAVLGTGAFAALGLLLAGTLRAEVTLAVANGLFLALLMLGGMVLPVDQLPDLLRPFAAILPATALADLLRISLASGAATAASAATSLAILVGWGGVAGLIAVRTFRWE